MGGRDVETEVCLRTHQVLHGLENFSVYYFSYLKKREKEKKKQTTLGFISTQLECGMAEMLRIRKKRLQIPISR